MLLCRSSLPSVRAAANRSCVVSHMRRRRAAFADEKKLKSDTCHKHPGLTFGYLCSCYFWVLDRVGHQGSPRSSRLFTSEPWPRWQEVIGRFARTHRWTSNEDLVLIAYTLNESLFAFVLTHFFFKIQLSMLWEWVITVFCVTGRLPVSDGRGSPHSLRRQLVPCSLPSSKAPLCVHHGWRGGHLPVQVVEEERLEGIPGSLRCAVPCAAQWSHLSPQVLREKLLFRNLHERDLRVRLRMGRRPVPTLPRKIQVSRTSHSSVKHSGCKVFLILSSATKVGRGGHVCIVFSNHTTFFAPTQK